MATQRLSLPRNPLPSHLPAAGCATSCSDLAITDPNQRIDVSKLQAEMASLWRYLLHFNLVEVVPNLSKEQLIDIMQRHFMSQLLERMVKNCGDYVHHSSSQSPPPPPMTPPPRWFTGY